MPSYIHPCVYGFCATRVGRYLASYHFVVWRAKGTVNSMRWLFTINNSNKCYWLSITTSMYMCTASSYSSTLERSQVWFRSPRAVAPSTYRARVEFFVPRRVPPQSRRFRPLFVIFCLFTRTMRFRAEYGKNTAHGGIRASPLAVCVELKVVGTHCDSKWTRTFRRRLHAFRIFTVHKILDKMYSTQYFIFICSNTTV